MALPSVDLEIKDGGLGQLPPDLSKARVKFGVCTGGVANRLYAFGAQAALIAALGTGPLVEDCALDLAQAGGTVLACPITASVAGTVGTVTPASTNTSPLIAVGPGTGALVVTSSGSAPPAVTLTGTPDPSVTGMRIEVTTGGSRTTAVFRWSKDQGSTWTTGVSMAATVVLTGSGLTAAFAVGTYYAQGEISVVSSFGTSPPAVTLTGTPAAEVTGVRIEITTGGARGTAVFRWSSNNGATWTSLVTTSATVALGTTGLTAGFATGTDYNVDNYYTAYVATKDAYASVVTTPTDDYEIAVRIFAGGTVGTASFEVSLDGGINWSPPVATAATYALDAASIVTTNTGVTLTFPGGTYAAGDSWTCQCTAPYYSSTDLGNAIAAALASAKGWSFGHILGQTDTAAHAATLVAAIETAADAAFTAHKNVRFITELPDVSDALIEAAFANTVAVRVMPCAGFAHIASAISGRMLKRSSAWLIAARAAKLSISQDLGEVEAGPVTGIAMDDDGQPLISRNEEATPGLADARFATLRTYTGGKIGVYITDGRLLCPTGSDFTLWQYGRVMDEVCRVAYAELLGVLNKPLLVNKATAEENPGGIDELAAKRIEDRVKGVLDAALTSKGHISDVSVQIDRRENILSTKTVPVSISVVPLGYAKRVLATIAYSNPKLVVA